MLEPEIRPPLSVPYVEFPVEVMAPQPIVPIVAMFLLPSRTTALFATAVPSVMPSSFSRSASFILALPMIKLEPAVIEPDAAIAAPKDAAPTACKSPEPEIDAAFVVPSKVTAPLTFR